MPIQRTFDQLLPIEREFLMKQRQGVLDQLAFLERKLNMPSSVRDKQERRDERRDNNRREPSGS